MDYKRIYRNIIKSGKERVKEEGRYYENHHIIPKFLYKMNSKNKRGIFDGNPNDPKNLVLLTLREHFICHLLLYKIYKKTKYGHVFGSILYKFFDRRNDRRSEILNSKQYERYRIIALKCISTERSGKIPAVDAKTGKSVGSIRCDHSKVISGEWVHHSKGKHTYYNKITGEKVYCKVDDERIKNNSDWIGINYDYGGNKNPNYKEMTEDRKQRVFSLVEKSIINNSFMKKRFEILLKEEFTEFKKISTVWINNNFGSLDNLIKEYNKIFGKKYEYKKFGKCAYNKGVKC